MAIVHSIVITRIPSEKARLVLAQHIATTQGISTEAALTLLAHTPVLYAAHLSGIDTAYTVRELKRLLVGYTVVDENPAPRKPGPKHRYGAEIDQRPAGNPAIPHPSKVMQDKAGYRRGLGVMRVVRVFAIACVLLLAGKITCTFFPILNFSGGWFVRDGGARIAGQSRQWARDAAFDDSAVVRISRSASRQLTALHFADSAQALGPGPARRALLHAAVAADSQSAVGWYRLSRDYADQANMREAGETRQAMQNRLGGHAWEIQEIIDNEGSLIDYAHLADTLCRLSYYTQTQIRRDLEAETYGVARSLRTLRGCPGVSLYAVTGPGSGLLVYCAAEPFPSSVDEFRRRARIMFVQKH